MAKREGSLFHPTGKLVSCADFFPFRMQAGWKRMELCDGDFQTSFKFYLYEDEPFRMDDAYRYLAKTVVHRYRHFGMGPTRPLPHSESRALKTKYFFKPVS